MKLAFVFLSLLIGFSASAADRKIGNVIVVERDIENVFSRCMEDLNRKPPKAQWLTCFLVVTKNQGEILLNKGGAFRLTNPRCEVDSEFGGTGLMINFQAKGANATREDSINCLRTALQQNQEIIATVQTIEQ
jgi:hypothetical protein